MIKKYILNEETRKKEKGMFIDLPCGNTHYLTEGMENQGEWAVLVHGYATPYFIYDKIAEGLVANGYKVLRYDLLGRGLSERVKKKYTPSLFATQLEQITNAILGNESFFLFGTSMGGTITTTYAAKHPDRVKKLVLLAPAGMQYDAPLYMRIMKKKILGELVFYTVGGKLLTKRCASEIIYSSDEVKKDYEDKFFYCTLYKGMMRCTLSSLRYTILNFKESIKGYSGLKDASFPILTIWGTADKTMPYYQSKAMQEFLPQIKLITYENSGHIFLYDEGERTLKDVLPFLAE